MTHPHDSFNARSDEPLAGEPLLISPDVKNHGAALVEPITPTDTYTNGPDSAPPPTSGGNSKTGDDDSDDGGSKIKAAALLAGAAAIANKVRQEAPRKVQEFREKRAAGRCVIVTEVDGRFLVIGPYKDDDAAQQDIFKVGGTAHVAELMSDTAFFAQPAQ